MPDDRRSTFEKVRAVAMTVREPKNAGEVADAADVARNTAEKYLQQLVEADKLTTVREGRETRYYPDPVTRYFDHLRDLVENHGKEELTDELAAIRTDIEDWQDEYGVETPDALRASVGDPDLSADERERRRRDAEDWEYFERQAAAIRQAIRLYDAVEDTRETLDRSPA